MRKLCKKKKPARGPETWRGAFMVGAQPKRNLAFGRRALNSRKPVAAIVVGEASEGLRCRWDFLPARVIDELDELVAVVVRHVVLIIALEHLDFQCLLRHDYSPSSFPEAIRINRT